MQNLLLKPTYTNTSHEYPIWTGELWTAKQRQMHRLHYVISYRASFKPELPDFFIRHYLLNNDITEATILDPFGGRGTTTLQANLLGFRAIHNDLNPVSIFLAQAKKNPPKPERLIERTMGLCLDKECHIPQQDRKRLLPFFHPKTLKEIYNLRQLILKSPDIHQDPELAYIGLTALSRLHGHSGGFFSVYSFPQISIPPLAQKRNNHRLGQKPEYRPIKARIIRKIKADLSSPTSFNHKFRQASAKNSYIQEDARLLTSIPTNSVDLVVTSPPFLDKVDYQADNWMRAWFLNMEEKTSNTPLSIIADVSEWCDFMQEVIIELGRVLKKGAHAVIEVGEVNVKQQNQNINLDELLLQRLPLKTAGSTLHAKEVFINQQHFTKLSNCWSIANNRKGTNTNRCIVVQKT